MAPPMADLPSAFLARLSKSHAHFVAFIVAGGARVMQERSRQTNGELALVTGSGIEGVANGRVHDYWRVIVHQRAIRETSVSRVDVRHGEIGQRLFVRDRK